MKRKKTAVAHCFDGILVADDWDENGKVVGVAIYTDRDKKYHCAPIGLVGDLRNYIQMRVRVEGTIERQPSGKKLINIKSIEKLKDEADEDQDADTVF